MKTNETALRIINIGLRGGTLASKLLFLLFIAKYFPPGDLGTYGLIVVTIAYATYLFGFEFYTFSSREIIKSKATERFEKIKNQIAFHTILYISAAPFLLLLFKLDLLPWGFAIYFFPLVIIEHLNQEIMRLLIALQHQIASSIALFIRQGLWPLLTITLMTFSPKTQKLEYILCAWLISSFLALIISARNLIKVAPIKKGKPRNTDRTWIKKGLKKSVPFFLASLSISLITTADRYWFNALQGADNLGAYVFYSSIAASALTFMDAGIFSFLYPKLLVFYATKNHKQFSATIKKMLIQVIASSVILALSVYLFSEWFFSKIGNEVYKTQIKIFYILVIMTILQALSQVPHYGLYAKGQDKNILIPSVISVPLFFICGYTLSIYTPLYSVPISLCIAYGFILIHKTISYRLLLPHT